MARQEILTAKCDRKECKTVVEIHRDTVAPEGWLQVTIEIGGKWDSASKMEFCSEKCVSLWARNRGSHPMRNGNNGHIRDIKQEVIEAIKVLESDGKWEWTIPELASVIETHPTSVRKYINELIDERKIEHRQGTGTKMDPHVYGKITGIDL